MVDSICITSGTRFQIQKYEWVEEGKCSYIKTIVVTSAHLLYVLFIYHYIFKLSVHCLFFIIWFMEWVSVYMLYKQYVLNYDCVIIINCDGSIVGLERLRKSIYYYFIKIFITIDWYCFLLLFIIMTYEWLCNSISWSYIAASLNRNDAK